MKIPFKKRVNSLGLSFQKEIFILILIILLTIVSPILITVFLKNIYLAIVALFIGLAILFLFISRYKSIEKRLEIKRYHELLSILSYFQTLIHSGNNVYAAFYLILPFCGQYLQDAVTVFLDKIDKDKSSLPYIEFSENFCDKTINNLMLSIYRIASSGTKEELVRFDVLLSNTKENYLNESINETKKTFEYLDYFPLVGAGLITVILFINIISIIGEYINVI